MSMRRQAGLLSRPTRVLPGSRFPLELPSMLARILACFQAGCSPATWASSGAAEEVALQELRQLVLTGGLLESSPKAVPLALASLLQGGSLIRSLPGAGCSLLVAASQSKLDEGTAVQLVGILMAYGADPSAKEGLAVVSAVQAGRLRVAEALLAGCPSGSAALSGMTLLPLLQQAISSPALPPLGQAAAACSGILGLHWVLGRMPPEHVWGLSVAGLPLTHVALQICASRLAHSGLEHAGAGQDQDVAWLIDTLSAMSRGMQQAAVERTAAVLELLVGAGAPPVPADQGSVPGIPPETWRQLRVAATAWPEVWSRAVHHQYHATFRAAARQLLLVAHRGFALHPSGSCQQCCTAAPAQGDGPGSEAAGNCGSSSGGSSSSPHRLPTSFHLPVLVVERVIELMATQQADWVPAPGW